MSWHFTLQVGICLSLPCSPEGERYKNLLPRLFEELGDQPRPSRLMARAQSHSRIPVKIFVKQNQIAPQGIVLKFIVSAVHRPVAVLVAQKNMRQRSREIRAR